MAVGDDAYVVTIFNARTCQEVATISHADLSNKIRGLTYINSTTFAGLSGKKVAFFSTETLVMTSNFDTGHTDDLNDMTFWQSDSGESFIVTGSNDDDCKGEY